MNCIQCLQCFIQCCQCPCCIKAFINRSFLDAHIAKRHPSIPSSDTKPLVTSTAPPAAERLPPVTVIAAPSDELDSIRDQLKKTEIRLSREIEARSEVERKVMLVITVVLLFSHFQYDNNTKDKLSYCCHTENEKKVKLYWNAFKMISFW